MLAREVDAGLRAVELQHVVILLQHRCQLLVQARVGPMSAAAKLAHDLPDQPWTAIGAAADHHAVCARLTKCLAAFFDGANVPVDDHGN